MSNVKIFFEKGGFINGNENEKDTRKNTRGHL